MADHLIDRSVSHDEIVRYDYDHDLEQELAVRADDSAQVDDLATGVTEYEYWGRTVEGFPWRVHLVVRGAR